MLQLISIWSVADQNISYNSGINLSGHVRYAVCKMYLEICAISCNLNVKDVKCFAIQVTLLWTLFVFFLWDSDLSQLGQCPLFGRQIIYNNCYLADSQRMF
jgi:hypothetical protein